ncbi:N-6 DNA methylase, partial [Gemmatimonadota bacterium]
MDFLNTIYKELDYESGALYDVSGGSGKNLSVEEYINIGEWLKLADYIEAEKVFFINNNPVIVFAKGDSNDISSKIAKFNKIWCMARPRLLFFATPGELTIYDLAQPPVRKDDKQHKLLYLDMLLLQDIGRVSDKLQKYHRENIESGRLFGDKRFGDISNRADKALIRDLKCVRSELIATGLDGKNVRYAHALIGRSIFIRYLEDRNVLTDKYFNEVGKGDKELENLLPDQSESACLDFSENKSLYLLALNNKNFTYALFKKLSQDFNGDIFPNVDDEESVIEQKHLDRIKELLLGDTGPQMKLFFFAYKFDVIPIDLISCIYEEFYHSPDTIKEESKARREGAFYTPPILAEFVLSKILTPNSLKKEPRVLDPACGSGIFLVEAFRRIVRYKTYKKGRSLTFSELKAILRHNIHGIEVNTEAANITSFSIYLSMLHYLEPPDILKQLER